MHAAEKVDQPDMFERQHTDCTMQQGSKEKVGSFFDKLGPTVIRKKPFVR